jgi:predicted nucleotide-binding protein (sugar kinase/HSP70/actin superfamily)
MKFLYCEAKTKKTLNCPTLAATKNMIKRAAGDLSEVTLC